MKWIPIAQRKLHYEARCNLEGSYLLHTCFIWRAEWWSSDMAKLFKEVFPALKDILSECFQNCCFFHAFLLSFLTFLCLKYLCLIETYVWLCLIEQRNDLFYIFALLFYKIRDEASNLHQYTFFFSLTKMLIMWWSD